MKRRPYDRLAEKVNAIRIEHGVAAAALVLVNDRSQLFSAAFGTEDWETAKPTTPDALFRIGSITKSFTGLALLKLQEQGKLRLDDGLFRHAPDAPFHNPWQNRHPVRLAHLLEHTSGLVDLTRAEWDNNDPAPLTLRQGLFFNAQPREALWPPGLHSSYSNIGAGYAAWVLQKVTSQTWGKYVAETLFKPLEMRNASVLLDEKTQKNLVTGYDTNGRSKIPYWHMTLRPFGAINATPVEMGHFVQMLLARGVYKSKRIFSNESIDRMERPKTTIAARAGLKYGYGLGNYQYIHRGFLFHGHGGDGDGYLARYGYNRDTNTGFFFVINAFNYKPFGEIRRAIEDFLIEGRQPSVPPIAKINTSDLQAMTGTYGAVTYRFPGKSRSDLDQDRITVSLDDGTLFSSSADGHRRALIPVSSGLFRREEQPVATIAIVLEQGETYLQGDMGNYRRLEDSE